MARFPDKAAFRCFGQTLTYADTDRLSRSFAAYLQGKLGVARGDRIAVEMHDERFTTRMAQRLDGPASSSEDSRAAAHMLESWIAAQPH